MFYRVMATVALISTAAVAQKPAYKFEVASVKRASEPANPNMAHSTGLAPLPAPDARLVNFREVSVVGMASLAYDILPLRIQAPDWMGMERYDVSAKVPDDAPKGHIREMVQDLLASRFHLKLHWNEREEQGYALVMGKSANRLKKSAIPEEDAPLKSSSSSSSAGHFQWKAESMDGFVRSLSYLLDHPVVNMTGLAGIYDITFDAAPDSMPGFRFGRGGDSSMPTIFTAVRDLGLNLEPRKVPVKRLVLDSADKVPVSN